jgi:hypothetical protein
MITRAARMRFRFRCFCITTLAAICMTFSFAVASEDSISLSRVFFVTSHKWYVLRNMAFDDDVLMFRKYSFSVIDGKIGGPEKTKDIVDFGCQRNNRHLDYVVFHFPHWALSGLNESDWKPRLPLHIGINNLSLTFDAEGELKNAAIFVDLSDRYKLNLLKMITAQTIMVDYGVDGSLIRIEQRTRTPDGEGDVTKFVNDFVTEILSPSVGAGKVTSYDTDGMLAACLYYKRKGAY